jgi:hypothetical protein
MPSIVALKELGARSADGGAAGEFFSPHPQAKTTIANATSVLIPNP